MYTSNVVEIVVPPVAAMPRIYQLAVEIQNWPQWLPHYRYLRIVEEDGSRRIADFGATREGFPCRWRAIQEMSPDEWRITYRHIGGITRGMWVEWRFESLDDRVRITIDHALDYSVPVLGSLFAHYIVGNFFVHNIAGKTLRSLKMLVEAEFDLVTRQ